MSAPASSPCYATDAAVAAHHHDHNTQQHAAHVHGHSSSLATAATASPAVSVSAENEIHRPFASTQARAHCSSFEQYQAMYKRSITDSDAFWKEMAESHLSWFSPFTRVSSGSFTDGDIAFFLNGKLNVAYNCIDRHVEAGKGDKVAIIWEGDEENQCVRLTYKQLQQEVCRCTNMLRRMGVRKGDTVSLYMPMVPALAIAMLACARGGFAHSVVFAGFSAEALADRIIDGDCRYIITADEGKRGGKTIPLKATVDAALAKCPNVRKCIVYKHTGANVRMQEGRDESWQELMAAERPYAPPEWCDSEDILFMLYTSGSTGKPKGIAHTTAGYLLYAALTTKYVFNLHDDDIHFCAADCGWVTGHSYIVYGPLCLGATTVMFESTPLYPDAYRYWRMIERLKCTTLYTAPTAIRALMKYPVDAVAKIDRSSLRVLGSVGEPINPEAWRWFSRVAGDDKVPIVDTYWQTETGGHVLTPLPGAISTKPGSATLPFFGIVPLLLSPDSGKIIEENEASGVLCFERPWPGICRTIYGAHDRYLQTYMQHYKGFYFTGDGAHRDADGYYWITGRVDDVANVSGHRIGSAEVESALVSHQSIAEAAVVAIPHELKGQALFAYVTPKEGIETSSLLLKELQLAVRTEVGGFAVPDFIHCTAALPKTRSGKIMRRILRKIASAETADGALGDTTTLADPAVVDRLIQEVTALLTKTQPEGVDRRGTFAR